LLFQSSKSELAFFKNRPQAFIYPNATWWTSGEKIKKKPKDPGFAPQPGTDAIMYFLIFSQKMAQNWRFCTKYYNFLQNLDHNVVLFLRKTPFCRQK
jgi:hypothetical protein